MDEIDPKLIRNKITEQVLSHNYDEGPLLLLAGPGTGKTFSLLMTIKEQINDGYEINNFFEVTLTNSAVDDFVFEAKKEISEFYDSSSTLHFKAKGILHRYAGSIGFDPGFTVINDFIEDFIKQDLSAIINISKDVISTNLREYQKASANCEDLDDHFSNIYRLIQKYYSAIDWFDVVFMTIKILEDDTDTQTLESNRFQFLLIDEYQDLNKADQRFIELLINNRNTLIAVGDDDQSVYSGRHANPSGIVDFKSRYPEAKIVKLPVSSRLPSNVISASCELIRCNEDRFPKDKLIPLHETEMRADNGFVISVNNKSAKAEKEFLANALETLINKKVSPEQILVLCNCKKLGKELARDIKALNDDLPIVSELTSDYDIDLDQNILDSIRTFLLDSSDNLSLRIIIDSLADTHKDEVPSFVNFAFQKKVSLWEAMNSKDIIQQVPNLAPLIEKLVMLNSTLIEIADLTEKIKTFIEDFDQIHYLLELIRVDEENDEEKFISPKSKDDSIRFITMHSSKGLDADFIFIPCMERSLSLPAKDIEEKRRLLYVALTRAKVGVIMSWAWSRRSPFRYKCSGTGGDVTGRNPSELIDECGIRENFIHPRAKKGSSEEALDLLKHHSDILYNFDSD